MCQPIVSEYANHLQELQGALPGAALGHGLRAATAARRGQISGEFDLPTCKKMMNNHNLVDLVVFFCNNDMYFYIYIYTYDINSKPYFWILLKVIDADSS